MCVYIYVYIHKYIYVCVHICIYTYVYVKIGPADQEGSEVPTNTESEDNMVSICMKGGLAVAAPILIDTELMNRLSLCVCVCVYYVLHTHTHTHTQVLGLASTEEYLTYVPPLRPPLSHPPPTHTGR